MEVKWCWRCEQLIPMLDREEFRLCLLAMDWGKPVVEGELTRRGIEEYDWVGELPSSYESSRYFIDMYRVLTSMDETNPNAIWHHRIDEFGPDCPRCEKPLRTPQARYCAACGFGKEDLTGPETPPLVKRRPDLFPGATGNS